MGIKLEFNPDLCLRNISEFTSGRRKKEECLPENLVAGKTFEFLKEGHRNFWFDGEVPLMETSGNGKLSRPFASVMILESTQFLEGNMAYTRGKYRVVEVFSDSKVHFESYQKIK